MCSMLPFGENKSVYLSTPLSLEGSVRRLVVASFTDEKTEIQRGNLSKFTQQCWDPNPEPDRLTTTLSVMPSTNERSANPSGQYDPATVLRTESKVQAKRSQAKHGRGEHVLAPRSLMQVTVAQLLMEK